MARKPYPGERPADWKPPTAAEQAAHVARRSSADQHPAALRNSPTDARATGLHPGQVPPGWVSPDGTVPKPTGLATKVLLGAAVAFVGLAVFSGLYNSATRPSGSHVAPALTPYDPDSPGLSDTVQALDERIGPDAISSYSASDRKSYPRLFAKLGSRIGEVGPLGRRAALLALQTHQCNRVAYVDVSERSTRADLQFFVDCDNETRVRVSEADIRNGLVRDVDTRSERMDRAAASIAEYDGLVEKAKGRVLASLRDPGSAEFGSVAISHKDGTVACGSVSSRNGFGGMSGQQPFIAFRDSISLSESTANFAEEWKRFCS